MPIKMKSPYGKQSRIGFKATRNLRRCKRPFSSRIMKSQEGLDKTYDRFQKLISQFKIHREVISQEDANLKLLRSLPSAWNNIALIMINKSNLDTLSMDDLYSNLKVHESEIKGQSSSSSNSQNVAVVTSDNSSSTNETVNIAHIVDLDNEDLEQIDTEYLKEMDLKWQVAMLTMRVKRFIKKTGRKLDLNCKETVSFDKTKIKCYNCYMRGHFAIECRAPRNQENRNRDAPRWNAPKDTSTTNALVVQDGIAAILTKYGQVPVNAAKQRSHRETTSVSASRRVNTAATRPNGNPHYALHDQEIFDSVCSRHLNRNKSYLTNYQEIDCKFIAFGGNAKGGKITRKVKIWTIKLDFEDVYFVKELKFNLFSVLQICDMKNSVVFTDTECVVLSPDFKLLDESQVLLKVLRNNNMYSFDLKNVVPLGGLTGLFVKATLDESNLWHRRLSHINFKTMNKLVRGNLVRGLPSKVFKNDYTCVACQKGKQHKASYKTKTVQSTKKMRFLTMLERNVLRMFTLVSTDGSSYVNLGGSILVNAATLPNADLLTDPFMPDIEDIIIFRILESLVVHMMMKLMMLFLAYASFMVFIVYQMDVKSANLDGTIEEEVIDAQEVPDEFYRGAYFLLRVAGHAER
uniref:Ribonuclease H-like domain-containing protein n=1 Tax=Tanacetum cinerariifolium TaxID=118510 RepID=A0A6L2L2P2_TANCI|nr:ribonuclease H-like domain-containing protein [Tanacetum cinerariifolium]